MRNRLNSNGFIAKHTDKPEIVICIGLNQVMQLRLILSTDTGLSELPMNKSLASYEIYNVAPGDTGIKEFRFGNHTYNLECGTLPNNWEKALKRYSKKIAQILTNKANILTFMYDVGVKSPVQKSLKLTACETKQDGTIIYEYSNSSASILVSNRRLLEYRELDSKLYDIEFRYDKGLSKLPMIKLTDKVFNSTEEYVYSHYNVLTYIASKNFKTLTRAMGLITTNYPAQCLNFTKDGDDETLTPILREDNYHIICLQCPRKDIVNKFTEVLEGDYKLLTFARVNPVDTECYYTDFTGNTLLSNSSAIFKGQNALSDIYTEFCGELNIQTEIEHLNPNKSTQE